MNDYKTVKHPNLSRNEQQFFPFNNGASNTPHAQKSNPSWENEQYASFNNTGLLKSNGSKSDSGQKMRPRKGIQPNSSAISRGASFYSGSKKNSIMRMNEPEGLQLDTPRDSEENNIQRKTTKGSPLNSLIFQENLTNFLPANHSDHKDIQLMSKFTLPQLKGQPIRRHFEKEPGPDIAQESGQYMNPGNFLSPKGFYNYQGFVFPDEQPTTALNSSDYMNRLQFEQLKKTRLQSMCQWKQKDVKGLKKNAYIRSIQQKNDQILQITKKSALEQLEVYTDRFPFLSVRKSILKGYHLIKATARAIIEHPWFDNISIFIIMANSIVMVFDDTDRNDNPHPLFAQLELIFFWCYFMEMVFKITGLGFVFGPDTYLMDGWNCLDFFIVISSVVTMMSSGEEIDTASSQKLAPGPEEDNLTLDAKALRVFRVMRPLKTISSVKGLKVIIQAVISALPLLQDTMLILMFFFIIFAIAGTQMLSGMLKNRCISVETGLILGEDFICGEEFGGRACPGGYFCAKTAKNPNFGVTNFDNVPYALLAVFQCVTLEGWSDIQKQVQQCFNTIMFLFFTVMVLIGAFFLLNLTLAVINSKFSEAHNKQHDLDQIELKENLISSDSRDGAGFNEEKNTASLQDQISIAQFINARMYAKKMIWFLRKRQEEKAKLMDESIKLNIMSRLESITKQKLERKYSEVKLELAEKDVTKVYQEPKPLSLDQRSFSPNNSNNRSPQSSELDQTPISQNSLMVPHLNQKKSSFSFNDTHSQGQSSMGFPQKTVAIPHNTIFEEDAEQLDDQLDQGNHEEEIAIFLAKSKQIQKMHNSKSVAKHNLNHLITTQSEISLANNKLIQMPMLNELTNQGIKMKGNIGPFVKNVNIKTTQNKTQKFTQNFVDDLDASLDLDNIVPTNDHIQKEVKIQDQKYYHQQSFELSLNSYESQNSFQVLNKGESTIDPKDLQAIPGINIEELQNEVQLITSDSEISEPQVQEEQNYNFYNARVISSRKKKASSKIIVNQDDIKRTFRRMLTTNFSRSKDNFNKNSFPVKSESQTNFEQSHNELETKSLSVGKSTQHDIESKFIRKYRKMHRQEQNFKEDKAKNGFLQEIYGFGGYSKPKIQKSDFVDETIDTKQSNYNDPFKDLDPLCEKVQISGGKKYIGTSQEDVIHQRLVDQSFKQVKDKNRYLQLKKIDVHNHDQDAEYDPSQDIPRSKWEAFQQKQVYQVERNSTDPSQNESPNEDDIQMEEQPFYTPTRVNYEKQTKQIYTQEIAKRSDIMITSTLSISLFPKDKRLVEKILRVKMGPEEVKDYIDEKCAFQSMVKENQYQNARFREKDMDFRRQYEVSFLHRAEFQTKTLTEFKKNVKILNSQGKAIHIKSKEVQQQEKIKHEQNIKASEKKGWPVFDREEAKKLLEGQYHEEDEDDIELTKQLLSSNELKIKSYQQIKHEERMAMFDQKIKNIFKQDEQERLKYVDEIPHHLRKEFNLPKQMGDYTLNFQEIKKHDINNKKQIRMWSGQDVLPIYLDEQKSLSVVSLINAHRVWPEGLHGILKRIRFVIRLHVKAETYDNFFTFFVFLNTITLAMQRYGMSKELEDFLEYSNIWFTWIFIYEMFVKILGIGIQKYCNDKMNFLDGGIVSASIFEMLYSKIMGGGESLKALNTLRMLRAIRVLRMLRLLRQLESMQTIIQVIVSSYMSFTYITVLMFLFIFIFTLLGMQMFTGYFKDDPLGTPSNNYDDFLIALFTVFQVLTMENWQSVLYVTMRNNTNKVQPYMYTIFYISWIFIGNFILLNLFLAILLDSFLEESDDQISVEEKAEIEMKKRLKKEDKKRKLQKNKVLMDPKDIRAVQAKQSQPEASKFYFGELKGASEDDLEDLDEDQIRQMFIDMGMYKKEKSEDKEDQELFQGIKCESSFYSFSKDNRFRILCYKMIKHPLWDQTVLILIALSSIKLGYDTYFMEVKEQTPIIVISEQVDKIFNYLFIVEMSFKLVAMGFCMDENSYLRDEWNQLDFFIVSSSIVDMMLSDMELSAMKILRMLRALRPLRFLTHNIELKLIVNALIGSLGGIFNVLIVVAVVFLIYAIFGVSLYSGKFQYCTVEMYILHTQPECEFAGGEWMTYDHNFDNALNGFVTLFVVSSLEGWPDIAMQAIEITDQDKGPKKENSKGHIFFFIVFILIGSFFFLNFFIGVLFMKFNDAQKEEQKGYTDKDLSWMDIQRLILKARPDYETTNVPKSEWRKYFHTLVSSQKFEGIIMIFIIANMAQMACLHEGQSAGFTKGLGVSNTIFSFIFVVEATLKLIAYGRTYFDNSWNKFDFFVVSASVIDFILEMMEGNSLGFLSVGPQIARVMRVLRVTRILRLAGKAEGLQAILQTIMFSIPALANVFTLLMLIYFMMSVLANFLFFDVIEGDIIDPDYKNFRNIMNAFILLFALSTGEDWNKVMFDCSRSVKDGCIEGVSCGSRPKSLFFFMSLILMTTHVMLNLFILVIIQQFEKYYLPEENMLQNFKRDQESFMKVWKDYTQDRYQCIKIKEKQLTQFFISLGDENSSLGFSILNDSEYENNMVKKHLLKMAIKSDNGYIFFNEILYRCMKRKYGNMKINKKMQIFELRTQYGIYLMSRATQSKNKGQVDMNSNEIISNLIMKENSVNPFLTVMNFRVSFKSWHRLAKEEIQKNNRRNTLTRSYQAEKEPKVFQVEIEQEQLYQLTSEEENSDSESENEKTPKKSNSQQNLEIQKAKKASDHLSSFKKRMTMKLNNREKQNRLLETVRLNGMKLQTSKGITADKSITQRKDVAILINFKNNKSKNIRDQKKYTQVQPQ